MSRPNPIVLIAVLAGFLAAFAGLVLMKGGLYLDAYEVDTYHLLDILFRMEAGQRPHLDFVTPLGILTVWPISRLMESGLSVGAAIAWSQVLVAACLFPFVVYAASSRFRGGLAYAFGILTLGLVTALTYGGAEGGISISMYYNRWAWSVSFVMLALAFLPPLGRARPALDGAVIGALGAVLLMLKVTYFVTMVPAAALVLLLGGNRRGFIFALLGGLAVIAVATALLGPSHWFGYLSDLQNVAGSQVRPFVGVPLNEMIAGNRFLGASVLGLLTLLMVSRAGHAAAGRALLILVPGFIYVTYQNFGNDPQWLLFVPFLLLALRPEPGRGEMLGLDLRHAMSGAAAVAIALVLPSLINLALSPLNHAAFQRSDFVTMLPEQPAHGDLFVRIDRANTVAAMIQLDERVLAWSGYADEARQPLSLAGVTFESCELQAGSRAHFVEITKELAALEIPEGSQMFTAGFLSVFWLFGPYDPLPGGAPWYYGGLSGIENADYVLVPKCSYVARVTEIIIREITAADLPLTLVRDNDLFALYALK